jgi:hypothetical protein
VVVLNRRRSRYDGKPAVLVPGPKTQHRNALPIEPSRLLYQGKLQFFCFQIGCQARGFVETYPAFCVTWAEDSFSFSSKSISRKRSVWRLRNGIVMEHSGIYHAYSRKSHQKAISPTKDRHTHPLKFGIETSSELAGKSASGSQNPRTLVSNPSHRNSLDFSR